MPVPAISMKVYRCSVCGELYFFDATIAGTPSGMVCHTHPEQSQVVYLGIYKIS